MDFIKNNLKNEIFVALLLVGVAVGIYLTQQTQIFKPRAESSVKDAFSVTGANGGKVIYKDGTFVSSDKTINIEIKDTSALGK